MEASIQKFLEFNGKTIHFLSSDGEYWVALRPICEALNVDHTWQLKKLKKDRFYHGVWSNPTMHDASGRLQKMVALPEMYIYMWLAQLPVKSDEHLEYVRKCANLLYSYFRGTITNRRSLLAEDIQTEKEIAECEKQLSQNEHYQRLQSLKAKKMRIGKGLKENDREVRREQLSLFDQPKSN